jgi:hypothetical protein
MQKSRRVGALGRGDFERSFVFEQEAQCKSIPGRPKIFEVALLRDCACPTQKLRRAGRGWVWEF